MAKIRCELLAHSNNRHLQQLYTGFLLLHRRGVVELTQSTRRRGDLGPRLLRVVVDGRLRVHYDTRDRHDIDPLFLNGCDYYFKRSCPRGDRDPRVRPLGLNYAVYPDGYDPFHLRRSVALGRWRGRHKEILRSFGLSSRVAYVPRLPAMHAPPAPDAPPRILFMVKAWDTDGRDPEVRAMNDRRAACIRTLRDEFPGRFDGGFRRTRYAREQYPRELMESGRRGSKKRYLKLLRRYPICVATTGLLESVGWKFAEYVAFSKAIVSEPLAAALPGGLAPERNYLEFRSPRELAAQAARLCDDADLRRELMANNAAYYERYLRPDALVLNTLTTALSGG